MSISLPEQFVERIKKEQFPNSELLKALDTQSPVSIRVNPLKKFPNLPLDKKVDWCENAYYLHERPLFTLDPLFHAGCYYPQEAGSMLLDAALRQLKLPEHPKVLDLCAAPGGKSTLLASFLNNKGLLLSNEVIHQRSWILRENLSKWGFSNTFVSNNDPSVFRKFPGFFDLILVDAPCSGEGMFRKDPKARLEWSENNVQICAGRQKRILADVWDSLADEGILIYSTCTFNSDENEKNVQWMIDELDAKLISLNFPKKIPQGRNNVGHYGIPGETETEGFFIAAVKKSGRNSSNKKNQKRSNLTIVKDLKESETFIVKHENLLILQKEDELMVIPAELLESVYRLNESLKLMKIGTNLGQISRKGLIPHEDLALNPSLVCKDNTIEITKELALKYLHGDTFPLEGKQGFHLLTFQNEPLGWIKHLGNRFNNLYPKEWRIRMKVE